MEVFLRQVILKLIHYIKKLGVSFLLFFKEESIALNVH